MRYLWIVFLVMAMVVIPVSASWSIDGYDISTVAPEMRIYGKAGAQDTFSIFITSPSGTVHERSVVPAGGRYTAILPLDTNVGGHFHVDIVYKRRQVAGMGIRLRSDEIVQRITTSLTPTPTPTPIPATATPTPTLDPEPEPTVEPTQTPTPTIQVRTVPQGYEVVDGRIVRSTGDQSSESSFPWVWLAAGGLVAGGIVVYLFKE